MSLFSIPTLPFPENNTHETRVKDIEALWKLAVSHNLRDKAAAIMERYPNGRQESDKSEMIQKELRDLLSQPFPVQEYEDPFTAQNAAPLQIIPPTAQRAQQQQTIIQEQERIEGEEIDESETDDPEVNDSETEEVETEDAESEEIEDDAIEKTEATLLPDAPPVDAKTSLAEQENPTDHTPAVQIPSTQWPEESLGTGIFSQLATTLGDKESVSLILSRSQDTLHITILPHKGEKELQETVQPLSVSGSPKDLDEELLPALGLYQQARKTAREVAQEMLDKVNAAAQAARTKNKSKPAPSNAANPERLLATLSIHTGHPQAVITLTQADKAGEVSTEEGKTVKIASGKYHLKITASLMEEYHEDITVRAGERKKLNIKLKPQGMLPL